jgi:hypothetical protein
MEALFMGTDTRLWPATKLQVANTNFPVRDVTVGEAGGRVSAPSALDPSKENASAP